MYSPVFTRAMIAGVLAVLMSVSLSVRPSRVGVLLKRLNVRSRKQRHTIAQGPYLSGAENLGQSQTGSPATEAPNAGGIG